MANKKTLYHSELCKLGPTQIKVDSDILKSQYGDKPDYVVLVIAGEERYYNLDSAQCAEFVRGRKGQTFSVVAEGRDSDAKLTYVGQSGAEPPRAAAAQAQRPPSQPAPQSRAAQPPRDSKFQPLGATVGMAMNNACANLTAQGKQLVASDVAELASDLLRVARWLEQGNLVPKKGAKAERPPAPGHERVTMQHAAPAPAPVQPAALAQFECANCHKMFDKLDGSGLCFECVNDDVPF